MNLSDHLETVEELPLETDPCNAEKDTAAVVLEGVTVAFPNGTVALDDVSLRVAGGEFISLIGPSGCGKTTILRLIAGLAEPTAGTVSIITRGTAGGTRHRADVGYVFQDPTLMPWATVFSNVWMPLRLRGLSRGEARDWIEEALARVGLAEAADAYPHELSGGMKMRVSIARALATGPRLLLMDEPFAALDEITRFKLNDDLLALWGDLDCTIVFVTHSVYEAVYLSNRIAVMSRSPGRIFEEITIDTIAPRAPDFRASARYLESCAAASASLRAAMADETGAAIAS